MEQLDTGTALGLVLVSVACILIWLFAHHDDDDER